MPKLSIKLDHVAALRGATKARIPDPVHAAILAELAGADSITIHLREDRSFIKDRDVYLLKETIKTELNLQIAPDPDLINLALEVRPQRLTLMPFGLGNSMTINGIDFLKTGPRLEEAVDRLNDAGVEFACLIDPLSEIVKDAARIKCSAVQFVTNDYSVSMNNNGDNLLENINQMAQLASKLGMYVLCGGGLDYQNIGAVADIDAVSEIIVGHSILSRSLMVGVDTAVRDMKVAMNTPSKDGPLF